MTFTEYLQSKIQERYESLKGSPLFEAMKSLTSYKSDKLTAKMWILPDGSVKSISGWHYQWIIDNREELSRKYGLKTDDIPASYWSNSADEQVIRIAAVKSGFFRVNYEIRNGALTIEGCANKFGKRIKDAIFMLVMENMEQIGYFNINLFNDKVDSLLISKSIPLFQYSGQDKFSALDGII